ncbi:MAG: hypothetical protein ACFE8L_01970 [Candidatus Hodarchaeota archaeon]
MNQKELFPDYQPKKTPDTVFDYLRYPKSNIFKILDEINVPNLEKLKIILSYFKRYKIEAKKNPGGFQKGNIAIGADLDQYYPSEEEILVSELGKMLKNIVESNPKRELEKVKLREGIKTQKIKFSEIIFRHVDVMGSGRYFYADKLEDIIQFEL